MKRFFCYLAALLTCLSSLFIGPLTAAARPRVESMTVEKESGLRGNQLTPASQQRVDCDFIAVDEKGNEVKREHTTFTSGEMNKCKAKWVPMGVAFCNSHTSPAAWKIVWAQDGGMPLEQKQCPAPGESQAYPCSFEARDVFGKVIYQKGNVEARTEAECKEIWAKAITNVCISSPNATHRTFFNWDEKLIRSEKCPPPTYPCTLEITSASGQRLVRETVQKLNQNECVTNWTDTISSTCSKNPAAPHRISFNNKEVKTGQCPGNPPSQAVSPKNTAAVKSPSGSYKNSCDKCTITSEGTLSCMCKGRSGLNKSATLNKADQCKNGVMNLDGQLICEGSFVNSCKDCKVSNDNVLCEQCKNKKGSWNNKLFFTEGACYDGLSNCDGKLICGPCR